MSKQSNLKIKLLSRQALLRLAIVGIILSAVISWAWLTAIQMPGTTYRAELPPLTQQEIALKQLLQEDIEKIAGEIGEHNFYKYTNLIAVANFLESSLAKAGYQVSRQEYKIGSKNYYNLAVEITGTTQPNEIVIIGGHYDSVIDSPGANDNTTGAAAVLELARIFSGKKTAKTLRFVEFVNEEPPFFQYEDMGSLVYAKRSRQAKENIVAMLSLETMGYYSDEPGSQKYPFPFSLFYPSQGNFITFIGNPASRNLVRSVIASFRKNTKFPSEGAAIPDTIPGVGWSDQWSFWQQGYQGVMVTDTAPARYPYYHTPQDTPDKVQYENLARVVSGLEKVVRDLTD